ncbi:MAG: DsbA family protein [Deltaproteobacteria bacterium]|nr:DsbA family protein [Deltaproteobacteria bacterium]
MQKDYGDDVRIVFKHYLVHPDKGTIPSHAVCAADKQGKFKPMYELIWEKGFKANRDLGLENMQKLAQEVGLDMAKFKADMEGPCPALVKQDQAEVGKLGTTGTPAFYINGRFLSGAQPIDAFKSLVDEELKKATDRIAKGEATAASYYDEFVMKRGLKQLAAAAPGAPGAPGGAPAEAPGVPGTPQPPGPPPAGKTTWSVEHGHWH